MTQMRNVEQVQEYHQGVKNKINVLGGSGGGGLSKGGFKLKNIQHQPHTIP